MDNAHFRSLLQNGHPPSSANPTPTSKPTLGSRARPAVPMTPRALSRPSNGEPPTKRFKSSSAPKGTKLARGYQDRTAQRETQPEEEDAREKRLKSLEEMLKLQQIDQATFEELKGQLGVGGDLGSTHLVRGLDWKLLERARKGEDLGMKEEGKVDGEEGEKGEKVDVDEELDEALERDVVASRRADEETVAEQEDEEKRPTTRDELLQQLKERRRKAQEALLAEQALSDRFKKVASDKPKKEKFLETVDGRRREVFVITDKEGKTKRKVRWLDPEVVTIVPRSTEKPIERMGMEVPAELAAKQNAMLEEQQKAEEDDDDIFKNVEDYDPLAGINSDEDGEGEKADATRKVTEAAPTQSRPRSYFGNTGDEERDRGPRDPGMLTALIKAAAAKKEQQGYSAAEAEVAGSERDREILERLKRRDRDDALDLDMGFGESRFGDAEDDEAVMLEGEKKSGRKRAPKKRKGDKDSFNDVMNVIKGRKEKV